MIRLIDTNIVSFRMKSHPLIELYKPHIEGISLAISFQTVAEMWAGAELAEWGTKKRQQLSTALENLLVLHSDDRVCQKWAEVRAARKHRTIPVADAWIAATALAHDLEFVTHNPADFVEIPGLTVLSEAN